MPSGGAYFKLNLVFATWNRTLESHTISVAILLDSHGKWIPEDKRWSSIAIEDRFQQHPIVESMLSKGNLKVAVKDIGECVVMRCNSTYVMINRPIHKVRVYSGQ